MHGHLIARTDVDMADSIPPPDSFCFPSRHCVCIHIDLPCSDNAIHASMSEDQVRELLEDLRVPADAVASADAMGSNAEPKPCPKSHYNHYLSIVHSLGALSFTMFDHRTHFDGITAISLCTCFRVYMQQNIISPIYMVSDAVKDSDGKVTVSALRKWFGVDEDEATPSGSLIRFKLMHDGAFIPG